MPTNPDITGTLHLLTGAGSSAQFLLMSAEAGEVLGVRGHRFWLLDADGDVLDEYGPNFECDCEYSFHTVFEMRDGTLFRYSGKDNDMVTERLRHWKAEVVCHSTRALARDDPDAVKLLQALEDAAHGGEPNRDRSNESA